jgi:hypothetical protein
LKNVWGAWNRTFFGNRCREFLFRFYNNILGINSRVAHFVPGFEAECSLCSVGNEQLPVPLETFIHVFFNCTYSTKYRQMVESDFFPEIINASEVERKKFWFLGLLQNNDDNNNLFITSFVQCFNFLLWQAKLKRTLPPVSVFRLDLCHNIKSMLKASGKLRSVKLGSNHYVCRHEFR